MVKYKVRLTNSFQTGCQKFQSTRKMLLPGISRELHGTQPSISSPLAVDCAEVGCWLLWSGCGERNQGLGTQETWMNQHSLAKWQATHLIDAMAASTPAALPVPLMMALPFQSMTAALMKNVCWPLSAKALIAFTAAGPPLSWRTATQRYCTNPGHCWFKRLSHGSSESHVTSSRRFKKQTTLQRLQRSFMRLVVKSTQWYFFLSNFRMSSGERRLNHGWSANSLRSCQLRRRFCPAHDVIAQMLSWRRDISPAHSPTLGCWALVHEKCVQLLDPH